MDYQRQTAYEISAEVKSLYTPEGRLRPGVTLVDVRMAEWQMGEQSRRIQQSVRRVLSELSGESLLFLRDSRLEVMVLPETMHSTWAYFPIHRRRWISRKLQPKPQTRVLLVIGTAGFAKETFEGYLRDHLGHTLLYLRSPKAWNDCKAAWKEWRSSITRIAA
jgi:hypothetical protein